MAIIKQKNKKTGITYVYESFSYRDKTTRQPRSRRRLIGKIDEATGMVVPTRKQNRKATTTDEKPGSAQEPGGIRSSFGELHEMENKIAGLQRENARLLKERGELARELERLAKMLRE